ncbi:hypothetical protein V8G54_026365 [Vigna mungo]|uniref:Ribosomal eL28/Mak16 domain-containing protein n=1 Tax=Vigna mungo TaxID=3915 RepID=A0AAQ3N096_VIGMU
MAENDIDRSVEDMTLLLMVDVYTFGLWPFWVYAFGLLQVRVYAFGLQPINKRAKVLVFQFRSRVVVSVPGQLIWEIVKKNNSFLVKEFGRGTQSVQFSREPNNLYNLNTFKYSGLANKKTVTIQPAGKDQSVILATTKTRKQNKPASLLHKSVMKKEFRRMAKAVQNQVADNYYRPDLKKAALARLSAVNRSLKVAKSGVKKRNRQAVKVVGRK